MSGAISESDSGGNDYDYDYAPTQGKPTADHFTFSWKRNWRKIDVVLISSRGQREAVIDEAGCFQPIKFQFILWNNLDKLQSLIEDIPTIKVEKIMQDFQLLEITLKSEEQTGFSADIATILSNEMENVFLKTIPHLPFTCKIAEELFKLQLMEGNMTMVRDDSKVYIVGSAAMREYINKTVAQFTQMTINVKISFEQKWKRASVKKFNLISKLSCQFLDVSIKEQANTECVNIHGVKSDVQKAEGKFNRFMSTMETNVKQIVVDKLVLTLLSRRQASNLFESILKRSGFDVAWAIDENYMWVVGEIPFKKCDLELVLLSHFSCVGFYASDKNSFCQCEAFTKVLESLETNLLVIEQSDRGCRVAATKDIIQSLLNMEKHHGKTRSFGIQVSGMTDQTANNTNKPMTSVNTSKYLSQHLDDSILRLDKFGRKELMNSITSAGKWNETTKNDVMNTGGTLLTKLVPNEIQPHEAQKTDYFGSRVNVVSKDISTIPAVPATPQQDTEIFNTVSFLINPSFRESLSVHHITDVIGSRKVTFNSKTWEATSSYDDMIFLNSELTKKIKKDGSVFHSFTERQIQKGSEINRLKRSFLKNAEAVISPCYRQFDFMTNLAETNPFDNQISSKKKYDDFIGFDSHHKSRRSGVFPQEES